MRRRSGRAARRRSGSGPARRASRGAESATDLGGDLAGRRASPQRRGPRRGGSEGGEAGADLSADSRRAPTLRSTMLHVCASDLGFASSLSQRAPRAAGGPAVAWRAAPTPSYTSSRRRPVTPRFKMGNATKRSNPSDAEKEERRAKPCPEESNCFRPSKIPGAPRGTLSALAPPPPGGFGRKRTHARLPPNRHKTPTGVGSPTFFGTPPRV